MMTYGDTVNMNSADGAEIPAHVSVMSQKSTVEHGGEWGTSGVSINLPPDTWPIDKDEFPTDIYWHGRQCHIQGRPAPAMMNGRPHHWIVTAKLSGVN